MIEWDAEKVMARLRQAANAGVLIGAQLVHAHATKLITSPPKTGRVYRRRGVKHQASAPGEAPASDTGRLVGSGDVYTDPENLSARVNWSTKYAEALEKGTERMEPRPFARRSLAAEREAVQQAMAEQVRKALSE